jgi:hypothetical protein
VSDLPSLLVRIQALVDGKGDDPPELLLERVEHTLTDGYAQALALDGERLRLERELAQELSPAREREIRRRLEANAIESHGLRELLGGLRRRAEAVRTLN